jgi:site-specific DNA recombinase
MGKLLDDRGNAMSPSYSSKNGVRYRFYVSSALLRGRKREAGSIGRVSAQAIERAVLAALKARSEHPEATEDHIGLVDAVRRVVVHRDHILIGITPADGQDDRDGSELEIKVPWQAKPDASLATIESNGPSATAENGRMIQSIVRAHSWLRMLEDETHATVEDLADSVGVHSKIVRQELRLAFLPPDITAAIVENKLALTPPQIPKKLGLSWRSHRQLLE